MKIKCKTLKIYANGSYLCSININKYNINIGRINTALSEKYYDCNPILLKNDNNETITDEHLYKMVKNGYCIFNIYQA